MAGFTSAALKPFEISFVDVTQNGLITLNVIDTTLSVFILKHAVDLFGTTGLHFGAKFLNYSGTIVYRFSRVLTSWIINSSSLFVVYSLAYSSPNTYMGGYESN